MDKWWQPGSAYKSTVKWVGRSRPFTGGGAVTNVGSVAPKPKPAISGPSLRKPGVWGGFENSINPHPASPNHFATYSEAPAPANTRFNGLG